jgi:hypothetical protein
VSRGFSISCIEFVACFFTNTLAAQFALVRFGFCCEANDFWRKLHRIQRVVGMKVVKISQERFGSGAVVDSNVGKRQLKLYRDLVVLK